LLNEQVDKKPGLDLKGGGARTATIEVGTAHIMAGPLPPTKDTGES